MEDTRNMLQWLEESPCNFLAVKTIAAQLEAKGYRRLDLHDAWSLQPGGRYYTTKNDTAIFAFTVGSRPVCESGFRIISSHSDSPCFKLKPNAEIYGDGGTVSLNVEKYGGVIMSTWFDRPLSMAGRVMLRTDNPLEPKSVIVDLKRPVCTIPNLAIHFNRQVNDGIKLSVQSDMKPVLGNFTAEEIEEYKNMGGIIRCMLAEAAGAEPSDLLDWEICLYPVGAPVVTGLHGEYFQSGRIDDLSMAFASLEALLAIDGYDTPPEATCVMAVFDNEETGSGTKQGAHSPVLKKILKRIAAFSDPTSEGWDRAVNRSFMISADNAHAWHPNYNSKYDPTNHPVMGRGPVIKINAGCKYMTDSDGAAVFHALCDRAGVNCQYFLNHSDVAGGSTLGNILTAQLDLRGVDMGCAIWGMHSAAETGSLADYADTVKVFSVFWY